MFDHSTPALAAVQFLSDAARTRIESLVAREALWDHTFARQLYDAQRQAHADQAAYDAWVCAQAPALEDLPW